MRRPADYSWSSVIAGIVTSTPFSMAVADAGDAGLDELEKVGAQ